MASRAFCGTLVAAMTNRNPVYPVDARVSAAQAQIIVRPMIGVLREIWTLIEKRFLAARHGKEYRPLLDSGAWSALDDLKKRRADAAGSDFWTQSIIGV